MGLSHLLVPFFVTSVLVSTHKKWYNPYPHYHKYLLKPFLNDIPPNCHRSQYSYLLFSTVQLQANKFRKAHIPCQLYKNNAFHHRHHQYTNHLQLLLLFHFRPLSNVLLFHKYYNKHDPDNPSALLHIQHCLSSPRLNEPQIAQ